MPLFALPLLLGALANPAPSYGRQLYTEYCATCHASDFRGTKDAPSLVNTGMATLDFYLGTGRMPAAVPWLQVGHRGEYLNPGDVAAIEEFLAPVVGGPPIPGIVVGGDLTRGRALYAANCEHCHGVKGDGGALGGLDWVPALHKATVVQVAEAIRVGPGQMPQFGEHQLSQDDLVDVVSYVREFDRAGQPAQVPPFRSTGPVPEGAIGWIGVIALIVFVFGYWRGDTTKARRIDTVRPDVPAGEE